MKPETTPQLLKPAARRPAQHGGCNTHLYFGKPKRDDKEQHDRKERSKSLEKVGMLGKFRKRPDESFFVNGLLEAAFFVIAEDKTNRG